MPELQLSLWMFQGCQPKLLVHQGKLQLPKQPTFHGKATARVPRGLLSLNSLKRSPVQVEQMPHGSCAWNPFSLGHWALLSTSQNKGKAPQSITNIPGHLIIQIRNPLKITHENTGFTMVCFRLCALGKLSGLKLQPWFQSLVLTSPRNNFHGHCSKIQ